MPSRLADRQIRASAALAAPTLDVRGPVSEALGRTGLTVPPASAEPAPAPEAAPEPPSGRTRPAVPGLTPTVKPFEDAAWPTRGSTEAAPLLGLTPDERRVHRILIDALVVDSQQGLGNGTGVVGLSYLERKKLEALDLAYINAELAKMSRPASFDSPMFRWMAAGAGVGAVGFLLALTRAAGDLTDAGSMLSLLTFVLCTAAFAIRAVQEATVSPQRKKIYEALRELALLVDDLPVSEAVATADRLIDGLAAEPAPASGADRAPRPRIRS
ncbi:MAG: hypothetical protein AAF594_05350 [Bacteroidota bacterium]